MRFRPCIDIHNGLVRQIVGGSLCDQKNEVQINFSSDMNGADFARLYREKNLVGGHAIILNPKDSEYYEKDLEQAKSALAEYPGGLQIGGGITTENATDFLTMGASHVIVTSYVFNQGKFDEKRLNQLISEVGKEHIVLDFSCRKKDDDYYIVTNRWQTFTQEKLTSDFLKHLSTCCAEFLVHGVDAEGTCNGPETQLIQLLANACSIPITYAGGIASYEHIEMINSYGQGKLDFTVGSALDLFGGKLCFDEIVTKYSR